MRGTSLILAALIATVAEAAQNDNDVEWDGVYSAPSLRDPLHPGRGEPFEVGLRVFRGDITGATVRTYDGATRRFAMSWVRNDGPFNVWQARVEGTESDFLYYRFEITDGSDTDYYNGLGMWGDPPSHGDFLVNTTPLGRAPLGVTLDGSGAIFRVWAPNAESVSVAGTFNGWSTTAHPMASVQGFWQARVPSVPSGSRYKFVVRNDGTHWRTDPRARRQTSSVGDSVVWRSTYEWNDAGWVTPYFEDMIVYELHTGTFSGDGDGVSHYPGRFRDVADRHLDHLIDLGVNVIELMPITEFAGDVSWGYNPAFQFALERAYGTPDDLKYLVDWAHQAGIAVILDVVFNHMGASDLAGNLLEYDGEEIYFYPQGNGFRETPWGPRLDYGRVEVRDYIRDAIRHWLEEYHLDGFRVDGTDFIKVNADGWRLLKDIAQAIDTVSRKAIAIAEQLPNDPAVTRPIEEGGAGMDSQWNDLFHDSLRAAIGEAAFGDPNVSAVAAGMNHFDFGGTRAVNYIESHDEAAVGGRITQVADGSNPHSVWAYGRGKLAYGLVMFTAGIPMILQGQELMENRRFGDARENRVEWEHKELYRDYYLACRDMTWLRRSVRSLRSDGSQNVYHVNETDNVIAWHRSTAAGDDVVIVASFNNRGFESYAVGMPLGGEWFELLNTDAGTYGGGNQGNGGRITASGGPMHGLPHSAAIVLPRMGLLVFGKEPVVLDRPGFLRGDCNADAVVDVSDAVRGVLRLFAGGTLGDCAAACDANGDAREDISDAIYVLGFLFRGGAAPPPPWPDCQETPSALPCARECGG